MNFIVKWALNSCVELFSYLFSFINAISTDLFNEPMVIGLLQAVKTVGFSLWALATVSAIIKLSISVIDGENIKIFDLGKRVLLGGIFWQYGTTVFIGLYQLIFKTASNIIDVFANYSTIKVDLTLFDLELWGLILLLVALYHVVKTFFDLLQRFWQFFVMLNMMYLYIPGYVTGNEEGMFSWAKQTIAVCLTQLFQSFLLVAGMTYFIKSGSITNFCVAIAAIIASSSVEKLMDRYGLATTGGKVGNMFRNALSMSFYTRSFLR